MRCPDCQTQHSYDLALANYWIKAKPGQKVCAIESCFDVLFYVDVSQVLEHLIERCMVQKNNETTFHSAHFLSWFCLDPIIGQGQIVRMLGLTVWASDLDANLLAGAVRVQNAVFGCHNRLGR